MARLLLYLSMRVQTRLESTFSHHALKQADPTNDYASSRVSLIDARARALQVRRAMNGRQTFLC